MDLPVYSGIFETTLEITYSKQAQDSNKGRILDMILWTNSLNNWTNQGLLPLAIHL